MNRNIHFENNAWFDTPALVDNYLAGEMMAGVGHLKLLMALIL